MHLTNIVDSNVVSGSFEHPVCVFKSTNLKILKLLKLIIVVLFLYDQQSWKRF